jgi:hypothetical protein
MHVHVPWSSATIAAAVWTFTPATQIFDFAITCSPVTGENSGFRPSRHAIMLLLNSNSIV